MLNFETNGALWIENNISQQQVLNRNEKNINKWSKKKFLIIL